MHKTNSYLTENGVHVYVKSRKVLGLFREMSKHIKHKYNELVKLTAVKIWYFKLFIRYSFCNVTQNNNNITPLINSH